MLETTQIFAATNAGNLYVLIGQVVTPLHILSIWKEIQIVLKVMLRSKPNPTLKFAPFGRWDAPSARPLAARWASSSS